MRFAFLVAVALVACSSNDRVAAVAPVAPHETVDEPTVEFLLSSAAKDFRAHDQPSGFRNVRVGYVTTREGEKLYLLCGEFLRAEWTPFLTLKTSDYEQWIGEQTTSWCQRSSFNEGDLTSALKSRFDAP